MTTAENPFPEIPDAALRQIWQRAVLESVLCRTHFDPDDACHFLQQFNDTEAEMVARGMEVE